MHVQDAPMAEPEYMLSAGLWEDIALPALKKVSQTAAVSCAAFSVRQPARASAARGCLLRQLQHC